MHEEIEAARNSRCGWVRLGLRGPGSEGRAISVAARDGRTRTSTLSCDFGSSMRLRRSSSLSFYAGAMDNSAMLTERMATPDDAELIAWQRQRMFEDSGQAGGEGMARMRENFVSWVRPRLVDGSYLGWLLEQDGQVVAGAGMWLMDFPPHWMDAEPARAYLLNFYVQPEARGNRLAGAMLHTAVAEANRRGIKVVSLHASELGRPIYERYGFTSTNERMLRLDGKAEA